MSVSWPLQELYPCSCFWIICSSSVILGSCLVMLSSGNLVTAELEAMAWPEDWSEADICCSSELELAFADISPGICDTEEES